MYIFIIMYMYMYVYMSLYTKASEIMYCKRLHLNTLTNKDKHHTIGGIVHGKYLNGKCECRSMHPSLLAFALQERAPFSSSSNSSSNSNGSS